jgi:hypothetical protein
MAGRMTFRRLACLLAASLCAWFVRPRAAEACGGCFAPTDTVTSVDSHRMVIALSTTETLLWDQIRYQGNPKDFVWVLPVPTPETQIEIADPVFFDELDSQTSPRIQPATPLFPCNFGASCGGGGDSAATGTVDGMTMPEEEVTVYSEETIGPYETATIGSEDADALRQWLLQHGYRVPPETEPVIDDYIGEGAVFVVLRLSPGQGVQAMQPVRVRYQGMMASFPLKMVTVGAQGALNLSLWVIAEQRYEADNYPTRTINPNTLAWDWSQNRSNYGAVFAETIEQAGGRGWIVEHASPLSQLFFSSLERNEVYALQPYPYLTRLRTRMLVDHLQDDLELAPASDYRDVSSSLVAWGELNRPGGDCDMRAAMDYGCTAAAVGARLGQTLGPTVLVMLGLAWSWRRRRARRRS